MGENTYYEMREVYTAYGNCDLCMYGCYGDCHLECRLSYDEYIARYDKWIKSIME